MGMPSPPLASSDPATVAADLLAHVQRLTAAAIGAQDGPDPEAALVYLAMLRDRLVRSPDLPTIPE